VDGNVPSARGRLSTKRRQRIGHRVVRVAVVNSDVEIRHAGTAGAGPATAYAASTSAATSAALPTLWHGSEGMHQSQVDVVELTRRRCDRMKIVLIARLVRRWEKTHQRLSDRI